MYKFIILSILLLLSLQFRAYSTSNSFDSLYEYAATHLSSNDNDAAINVGENLLLQSTTPVQRIRSLMLLATLHRNRGLYVQAINYANTALKIARETNDINWQLRANGLLSAAYRSVFLFHKGSLHFQQIQLLTDSTKLTEVAKAILLQEHSFYLIEDGKYNEAINELQSAKIKLENEKNEDLKIYYQANNYFMLGNCFLKLKNVSLAKINFNQSLSLIGTGNLQSEIIGFNHLGLAEVALQENSFQNAIINLQKADSHAILSQVHELKLQIANLYARYYEAISDNTKALEYRNKYVGLFEEKVESIKNINNQLHDFTTGSQDSLNKSSITNLLILFLSVILVTFLLLRFFFKKRTEKIILSLKQKADKEDIYAFKPQMITAKQPIDEIKTISVPDLRDEEIIDTIDSSDPTPEDALDDDNLLNEQEKLSIKFGIAPDTSEAILQKLNTFELQKDFLDTGLSLSKMANNFNTNTKYISIVINYFKKMDFHTYINTLRINYIVDKLKNDENFLDYKIAYLATHSGFSTHSKFTSVFKQITGTSPQALVKEIKSSHQDLLSS